MADRPFMDPSAEPAESALESVLSDAYPRYCRLLELADGCGRSWGYGRSGGWMLKVFDRQKALFYLIPLRGGFKVSLTVRETEHDQLLADDELAALHGALASAKKYPEGFAMAFEAGQAGNSPELEPFMRKLIALRKAGG